MTTIPFWRDKWNTSKSMFVMCR